MVDLDALRARHWPAASCRCPIHSDRLSPCDAILLADRIEVLEKDIEVALKVHAEACDRIEALEAALKALAWNEVGGRCWCFESPEITGYHDKRCTDARAALDGVQS